MSNRRSSPPSPNSGNGNKNLSFVPVLYYTLTSSKKPESEEKVGNEVNFHLGEKPLVVDNPLILDPRVVSIVKALARRAAEADFEALKNTK